MTGPKIALVVARSENGVIGKQGKLPWRQKTDLGWFRRLTIGKPVIMGRRTFESIGRALPKRTNIVVTRTGRLDAPGATTVDSLEAALSLARVENTDEICVIGGGEIYRHSLPSADRLYLTVIEAEVEGDTYFPDIDPAGWRVIELDRAPSGPEDDHPARLERWDRKVHSDGIR